MGLSAGVDSDDEAAAGVCFGAGAGLAAGTGLAAGAGAGAGLLAAGAWFEGRAWFEAGAWMAAGFGPAIAGVCEGVFVLELEPEDQFTLRVQRPEISLPHVFRRRNTPDAGRETFTS